jgi:hypothetical protein
MRSFFYQRLEPIPFRSLATTVPQSSPRVRICLALAEYARGCAVMFAHPLAMTAHLPCQTLVCAGQRNS